MSRWPKIYWNGLYTKKQFLALMLENHRDHLYLRMKGDTFVPPGKIKRNDLYGWMTLVNARWAE